ncbi:MAG: amidohydrolase [Bacteroidota bacterium]
MRSPDPARLGTEVGRLTAPMRLLLAALALLLASPALAQTPADLPSWDARGDVLIRNATVHTVTNGTLGNTDVLVRDGRIDDIGQNLRAPRGIEVVDATGMHLTPGMIDAHSHIALSSVNEASNPIVAEVQMRDAVNPSDIGIYRALAGGTTSIHVMHGSANPIGGENETLKLRWGTLDPDGLLFEGAPRTIKFALGENPTRVHGQGRGIRPRSRMGIEQVFREAFTEAQMYRAEQETAEREGRPLPPINRRMETLADILSGEVLVHAHSYRSDEILMLLDVLQDFGVSRMTFQHANEAYKVAPELAAAGAYASVFSDWWSYKFEVYYSSAYNAAVLARNGVRTSVNSDDAGMIRHLYHEAAKSQRYGSLTDDEALALVTINPAYQLGIEDRVGSIEEGKDADLALFTAHPLSIYTTVAKTYVDGIARFDAERDGDDQRLYVDPDSEILDSFANGATLLVRHADGCMVLR